MVDAMTKSELIERLANKNARLAARDVDESVKAVLDAMTLAMATGSRMAQYQLTAGHASAEYQLIGDTGQKRLYLQCADTLSAQERTTLAEGFRLLYL